MVKRKPIEIVLSLLNSILFVFSFYAIAFGTRYLTRWFFEEASEGSVLLLRLVAAYSTVYLFAIFRALFGILALDSERSRQKVLAHYAGCKSFSQKLKFHLTNAEYWLGLLPFVFFALILPVKLGYEPILTALFGNELPSPTLQKLTVLAVSLPLFILLSLLAELKVAKRLLCQRALFEKKKRQAKATTLKESVMIGISLFGFAYLIPMALMAASLLVDISYAILPALVAIILLLLSARYIRAFGIRAKFLKKLKKAAEDRRHRISEIKHPYRSLLFPLSGFHFTLTSDGKTYSCKLLCSVNRKKHIYFNEDGTGNYVRIYYLPFVRVGLAQELFRTHKAFTYDFDADGQKLLIICPVPGDVRVARNDSSFVLPMGERIGDYKVYNATTFLGAMERGVLDR